MVWLVARARAKGDSLAGDVRGTAVVLLPVLLALLVVVAVLLLLL